MREVVRNEGLGEPVGMIVALMPAQVQRLARFKAGRDSELVARRLQEIREAARGTDNMLPVLRTALKDRCSVGEVCGAMRDVFGDYQPTY